MSISAANGALNARILKLASIAGDRGDAILDEFLEFVRERKLELYPAQEEAVLELIAGKNVILNTPTGSGKSLVALALHFDSLARGRRSFYTSPIKALVNEKFLALCRDFGPEQVGMITGDATVNPGAPIICCTAEILMNDALRLGDQANIQDVVMDEFHYYSDRERGVAWQVPLLVLSQTRFLLMSATLGDTTEFEDTLTRLNHKSTAVVRSTERPVPLDFQYSEYPLHEMVAKLVHLGRAPIYLVNFTQRECAERAQDFLSVDLCSKEEKKKIAEALAGFKFSSPYGKELQRILRHGLGIHHAGLLPKYRILVEKLAQQGLLKIIFGTDTLGVGVNVPIRTVLLTKLCKYDGEKTSILAVRDFQQISGRAGRKGFDDLGTVVVQAPEHIIENIRNEQKAAGDPKRQKKLVKQKPPEKGYLPWDKAVFEKLVTGQPEALVSRFKVNHAILLQVLSRPNESGCDAMRKLIRDSHESVGSKKRLRKVAFQLFRSLVDRRIIELNPLRVHVDLQADFSLNHALSLYLIDTIPLLNSETEQARALDVITLVESILENPDLVLRKQLDRIKTEKMQELKAQGMEYDERIEELEKLEYPKPLREFVYDTFNRFAADHPWVGQENIRPKSIAREMWENFYSFADYVREYDLQRSEGLLLRYVSDFYKTLVQNVPGYWEDPLLYEAAIYFRTMLQKIDSSLVEEWERMKNPDFVSPNAGAEEDHPVNPVSAIGWDRSAFRIQLRNDAFQVVKLLARRDFAGLVETLSGVDAALIAVSVIEQAYATYLEAGHGRLLTDQSARSADHFRLTISEDRQSARIEQTLVDLDGHNDWVVELSVVLEECRREGGPVLYWVGLRAL